MVDVEHDAGRCVHEILGLRNHVFQTSDLLLQFLDLGPCDGVLVLERLGFLVVVIQPLLYIPDPRVTSLDVTIGVEQAGNAVPDVIHRGTGFQPNIFEELSDSRFEVGQLARLECLAERPAGTARHLCRDGIHDVIRICVTGTVHVVVVVTQERLFRQNDVIDGRELAVFLDQARPRLVCHADRFQVRLQLRTLLDCTAIHQHRERRLFPAASLHLGPRSCVPP